MPELSKYKYLNSFIKKLSIKICFSAKSTYNFSILSLKLTLKHTHISPLLKHNESSHTLYVLDPEPPTTTQINWVL